MVVGFHYLEKKTPGRSRGADRRPRAALRLPLLGSVRANVSQYYKDIRKPCTGAAKRCTRSKRARATQAEIAHIVADAIVQAHLKTMLRLGVEYDVLPRESEILHLKFWAAAFELLKQRKAIYLETEGKNAGCWVMPAAAFSSECGIRRRQGDRPLQRHGHLRRQGHRLPALEIRSARQGFLLPAAAALRGRARAVGHRPTSPQTIRTPAVRARQRGLQRHRRAPVLSAGRGGGGAARARLRANRRTQSIHFSYEMVALSPRCCVELGIELSEEDKQAALRRSLRAQGPGRQGRRPDRQADRQGARRSRLAASGRAAGGAARSCRRRSPSARCATSC